MNEPLANIGDRGRGNNPWQRVQWEVIKNYEYSGSMLSKVTLLYIVKDNGRVFSDSNAGCSTLVRLGITQEAVLGRKFIEIEIMDGIFPYVFICKKRNNIARLHDMCEHLREALGISVTSEVEAELVSECQLELQKIRSDMN